MSKEASKMRQQQTWKGRKKKKKQVLTVAGSVSTILLLLTVSEAAQIRASNNYGRKTTNNAEKIEMEFLFLLSCALVGWQH